MRSCVRGVCTVCLLCVVTVCIYVCFVVGILDEVRVLSRLVDEEEYLLQLLLKPSLNRENKMRIVGAHVNFDRNEIVDVLGNIDVNYPSVYLYVFVCACMYLCL